MNKQKYTYLDIVRIKSQQELVEIDKTLPTSIDELGYENMYEIEGYVTYFSKQNNTNTYKYRVQHPDDLDIDVFLNDYEIEPTGKKFDPGFEFTEPKFKKLEIVRIKSANLVGHIKSLGFPIFPEGKWYYLISTPKSTYDAREDDLESTGEFLPQEEYDRQYDGSSLKVSSEGDLLEQNIVNPTWEQRTTKTPGFKKDN